MTSIISDYIRKPWVKFCENLAEVTSYSAFHKVLMRDISKKASKASSYKTGDNTHKVIEEVATMVTNANNDPQIEKSKKLAKLAYQVPLALFALSIPVTAYFYFNKDVTVNKYINLNNGETMESMLQAKKSLEESAATVYMIDMNTLNRLGPHKTVTYENVKWQEILSDTKTRIGDKLRSSGSQGDIDDFNDMVNRPKKLDDLVSQHVPQTVRKSLMETPGDVVINYK